MNSTLADLLHGAGLGDIVIPKKDFIKEHRHLIDLLNRYDIPALKKEAASQASELRDMTGGTRRTDVLRKYDLEDKSYSLKELSDVSKVPLHILQEVYNRGVGAYRTSPKSVRLKHSYVKNVDAPMSAKLSKENWGYARVYSFLDGNEKHDNDLRRNISGGMGQASGFIRRLMAENALKHKGQYKKPTFPLAKGSTMNQPAEFDYRRIANNTQRGINASEYGASPFIQKHFGLARSVPFERQRGEAPPTTPYKTKRKSRATTEETEEQKKARKAFVVPVVEGEEEEVEVEEGDKYSKEATKKYIDLWFKYDDKPIRFYVPATNYAAAKAEAVWFGAEEIRSNKIIYQDPQFKVKPGFNMNTVKVEDSDWDYERRVYRTQTYKVPITECVVRNAAGENVEITECVIDDLKRTDGGQYRLGKDYGDSKVETIRVLVKTKKPVDKKFHRYVAAQQSRWGSVPGKTINNELRFYLKEVVELNREVYAGYYAAMLNYGAKTVFKRSDAKRNYNFDRSDKPTDEEAVQLKKDFDKMIPVKTPEEYTLSINGKLYILYPGE